jgi:hypothetical protein
LPVRKVLNGSRQDSIPNSAETATRKVVCLAAKQYSLSVLFYLGRLKAWVGKVKEVKWVSSVNKIRHPSVNTFLIIAYLCRKILSASTVSLVFLYLLITMSFFVIADRLKIDGLVIYTS